MIRIIASTALGTFLFTTLSAPYAQASQPASIWQERRTASTSLKLSASQNIKLPEISKLKDFPRFSQITRKGLPSWFWLKTAAFGEIESVYLAPGQTLPDNESEFHKISHPLIIHIQDAHEVSTVQNNVESLMQTFVQTGVRFAGLEGAAGPLNKIDEWSSYPDQKKLASAAHAFLKFGYFSGAETAGLIQSAQGYKLCGLENPEIYQRQVSAFKESIHLASSVQNWTHETEQKIQKLKTQHYSPQLKALDQMQSEYKTGKIKLGQWLEYLIKNDKRRHVRTYPAVQSYWRAYQLERNIDFAKVERAQTELLRRLASHLTEKDLHALIEESLAYRLGSLRYGEFYRSIEKRAKRLNLSITSDLQQYIEYASTSDAIAARDLFRDITQLEKDIWNDFISFSPAVKDVHELDQDFHLLKKALDFQFSPDEGQTLISRKENILQIPARLSDITFSDKGEAASVPSSVKQVLENACLFSRLSDERSSIFVNTLLNQIKAQGQKTAVLVAGGYHTQAMTQMLTEHGISNIVIRPKINMAHLPSGYHSLESFRREPRPLEKVFSSEKLFLKSPLVFGNLGGEKAESVQRVFKDTVLESLPLNEEQIVVWENKNNFFPNLAANSSRSLLKAAQHLLLNECQHYHEDLTQYHSWMPAQGYSALRAIYSLFNNPMVLACHYGIRYCDQWLAVAEHKTSRITASAISAARWGLFGLDVYLSPWAFVLHKIGSLGAFGFIRSLESQGIDLPENVKNSIYFISELVKDFVAVPVLNRKLWESELQQEHAQLNELSIMLHSQQYLSDNESPTMDELNVRALHWIISHESFVKQYGYSPVLNSPPIDHDEVRLVPHLIDDPKPLQSSGSEFEQTSLWNSAKDWGKALVIAPMIWAARGFSKYPRSIRFAPVILSFLENYGVKVQALAPEIVLEKKILQLYGIGQNMEAAIMLNGALKQYPECYVFHRMAGKRFEQSGYYDRAMQEYKKTAELLNSKDGYSFFVGACIRLQFWDEAMQGLNELIQLKPEDEYHLEYWESMSKLLKSIKTDFKNLRIRPSNLDEALELARFYGSGSNWAMAVTLLRQANAPEHVTNEFYNNVFTKSMVNVWASLDVYGIVVQGSVQTKFGLKHITFRFEEHNDPDTLTMKTTLDGLSKLGLIVCFFEGLSKNYDSSSGLLFGIEDNLLLNLSALLATIEKKDISQLGARLTPLLETMEGQEAWRQIAQDRLFDKSNLFYKAVDSAFIGKTLTPEMIRDLANKSSYLDVVKTILILIKKIIPFAKERGMNVEGLAEACDLPEQDHVFRHITIDQRNYIAAKHIVQVLSVLPKEVDEIVIRMGEDHLAIVDKVKKELKTQGLIFQMDPSKRLITGNTFCNLKGTKSKKIPDGELVVKLRKQIIDNSLKKIGAKAQSNEVNSSKSDAANLRKKIIDVYNAGQKQEAVVMLQDAINQYPEYYYFYMNMAQIYEGQHLYDKAIQEYKKMAKIWNDKEGYEYLITRCIDLQFWDEAIMGVNRILQLEPGNEYLEVYLKSVSGFLKFIKKDFKHLKLTHQTVEEAMTLARFYGARSSWAIAYNILDRAMLNYPIFAFQFLLSLKEAKIKMLSEGLINIWDSLDVLGFVVQGSVQTQYGTKNIAFKFENHENADSKNLKLTLRDLAEKSGRVVFFREGESTMFNATLGLLFGIENDFLYDFTGVLEFYHVLTNIEIKFKAYLANLFALRLLNDSEWNKAWKQIADDPSLESNSFYKTVSDAVSNKTLTYQTIMDFDMQPKPLDVKKVLSLLAKQLIPLAQKEGIYTEGLAEACEHPERHESKVIFDRIIINERNRIAAKRIVQIITALPAGLDEIVICMGWGHIGIVDQFKEQLEMQGLEFTKSSGKRLITGNSGFKEKFPDDNQLANLRNEIIKNAESASINKKQYSKKDELNLFPEIFTNRQAAVVESVILSLLTGWIPALFLALYTPLAHSYVILIYLAASGILGWLIAERFFTRAHHYRNILIDSGKPKRLNRLAFLVSLPFGLLSLVNFHLLWLQPFIWMAVHVTLHYYNNVSRSPIRTGEGGRSRGNDNQEVSIELAPIRKDLLSRFDPPESVTVFDVSGIAEPNQQKTDYLMAQIAKHLERIRQTPVEKRVPLFLVSNAKNNQSVIALLKEKLNNRINPELLRYLDYSIIYFEQELSADRIYERLNRPIKLNILTDQAERWNPSIKHNAKIQLLELLNETQAIVIQGIERISDHLKTKKVITIQA